MKTLVIIIISFIVTKGYCQNISFRSNETSLDFSDPRKNYSSFVPKITWSAPESQITFLKEGKIQVNALVESKQNLKTVSISIEGKEPQTELKKLFLKLETGQHTIKIGRTLTLEDGISELR